MASVKPRIGIRVTDEDRHLWSELAKMLGTGMSDAHRIAIRYTVKQARAGQPIDAVLPETRQRVVRV